MFFTIFLHCLLTKLIYASNEHPILIIVSYDAFRYDFLETKNVPNLNRLKNLGTYADHLINVFPTKTFPNHHSIATGIFPETHGILGNSYFNTTSNESVHMSYEMFHYNDNVVPIWRQNEDADESRHSAIMMWPGGCYPYQNKNITYCKEYDPSMDWFHRIDMVISWLTKTQEAPNLVMIYFEQPDANAHIYGMNSDIVNNLIKKLDNVTQYLDDQLAVNGLKNKANVIHLSDHGLIDVTPKTFINITQYLLPNTYSYAGSSPILQIYPKQGLEDEVYNRLKSASTLNGHFTVYKRDEYPERWHYKDCKRTPPIIVMAEVGYALDDLIIATKMYAEKYNLKITDDSTFGVHGYENIEHTMFPFFMARGPKIKINHRVPPFNTVDLFNLFCKILEISPTKNNGTLMNVEEILSNHTPRKYSLVTILIITGGGLVMTIILVSCAALVTLLMIKRQQSITTTAALNKRFPQTFQGSIEAQHLLDPEEA